MCMCVSTYRIRHDFSDVADDVQVPLPAVSPPHLPQHLVVSALLTYSYTQSGKVRIGQVRRWTLSHLEGYVEVGHEGRTVRHCVNHPRRHVPVHPGQGQVKVRLGC